MSDVIEKLAVQAFLTGATDLFLRENHVPRVRVNGEMQVLGADVTTSDELVNFWQRCGVDVEQNTEKDLSLEVEGGRRLRVNLYQSLGELAAVLRPIKQDVPSLLELGAPAELLTDWVAKSSGIVLVSGPTGSGKSTTLASMLAWLNENATKHVVTVEDPIEYLFSNNQCYFSQRELHTDTPSFTTALRSALRQSPDVIFVGEIRDFETAQIALQAAETGHLVLATLHSSGVTDTLQRLANLFPSEQRNSLMHLLADHLVGVISQQLLPRLGGGLLLAVEHLQNAAATRRWICEEKLNEIVDHMNRADDPANCSAVRFLAAATQQGFIEEDVARGASPSPQDFDRIMRGIS